MIRKKCKNKTIIIIIIIEKNKLIMIIIKYILPPKNTFSNTSFISKNI